MKKNSAANRPPQNCQGTWSAARIDATPDCIDAAGRRIGEILSSYLTSNQADLLVMGAYGHSRVREFILGGATRSMLIKPPLPILLSH